MQFRINQMIYLQVASIDVEEEQKIYKSRIADIAEDYIGIEIPIDDHTGKWKRLYPGDNLSVHFITDGGVKNFFQTAVIGYLEEQIRQVLIAKPDPGSITQVQRRNFLRVGARLETAVKVSDEIRITALTEDLSGGGLSFLCAKKIPIKEHQTLSGWLLIHYRNGGLEHVPYKGEVVRVKPLENHEQIIMVQFTEIQDKDRQKVIRYCFERQIENRKG
ncbi:flagellar brake protein [Marinicrinis sediminis]|uniref:Flagellar brake protein n=1 Tax=Marinicrinis sediminis TaxID=1652465 RepID=A0ABW5RCV1_9BACL